jgi:CHAT domain-containing protein
LPGAQVEAEALERLLRLQPDVESLLVSGPNDRTVFIETALDAHLIHFAGHGHYDVADPSRTGLVFREGSFGARDLAMPLGGMPIVFANACETGRLGAGVDQSWSGLAAAFIARGAVNYLGSLWPVFDEGSRRVAELFYEGVCRGETVGEALRQARLDAFARNDLTWAAFVLFGCPRTRLRASASPAARN